MAGGYLGALLVGMFYLSIGLFCSALTSNQIVAAITSFRRHLPDLPRRPAGDLGHAGLVRAHQRLPCPPTPHATTSRAAQLDSRPVVFYLTGTPSDAVRHRQGRGVTPVEMSHEHAFASTEAEKSHPRAHAARLAFGLMHVAAVLLAAVLAAMVNYLAQRHYVRADWSHLQFYAALRQDPLSLLGALSNRRQRGGVLPVRPDHYEDVQNLLKEYALASRHLRWERVDPNRDLARPRSCRAATRWTSSTWWCSNARAAPSSSPRMTWRTWTTRA
jgi:hypothetical protein